MLKLNLYFVLINSFILIHDNVYSQPNDLGNVIFVNILYRHGDRTPRHPYPNDPYRNESLWPVPFGQLTNIGKEQHLQLGHWLRERYDDLLDDEYSPYDIYVRSTDMDRTLMSALANLAGLYPPKGNQIWNSTFNWMPIPVHTLPLENDIVLGSIKNRCKRYRKERRKVLKLPEFENIDINHQNTYEYLTEKTGSDVKSFLDVTSIYDTLFVQSVHNKTLPEWVNSTFFEELRYLGMQRFRVAAYNAQLQRLKSGLLLEEMLDHMLMKANEYVEFDKKMWIYSAHDGNVANMLLTLGLPEFHGCPYTTLLAMELRENSGAYFVTIYYKYPNEEPQYLTFPGCTLLCPLDEFERLTKHLIPENWIEECSS